MTPTLAEIEAMPAEEEMNKLISELVMGRPVTKKSAFQTPKGYFSFMTPQAVIETNESGVYEFLPDYSGDTAQAMAVFSHLARKFPVHLENVFAGDSEKKIYNFWAWDNNEKGDTQLLAMAYAETIPLAIGRGALMVAMKDEE